MAEHAFESRFDRLLEAMLLLLKRVGTEDESVMTEDKLERAMFNALHSARFFIKPSTFAGGGS